VTRRLTIAVLVAVTQASVGCAPVVRDGPAIALSPALIRTARIDLVTLSTAWLRTDTEFADTFTEEVAEELRNCATGDRPLQLRVHVAGLKRAGRVETLVSGAGRHRLSARAEFVDPKRGAEVVGRYAIEVEVDAGGRLVNLVSDREMMVAEGFGRALCTAAFGSNPRRTGFRNATP
jgi:hypothetical protein